MTPRHRAHLNDGRSLQVLRPGQYLLCHTQTVLERAETLRLLRQYRHARQERQTLTAVSHALSAN